MSSWRNCPILGQQAFHTNNLNDRCKVNLGLGSLVRLDTLDGLNKTTLSLRCYTV